jgi:tetratricopeptide (TPR) repeat protein
VGELASDRKRVQEAENAYVRAAAIYETASDKEGLSAALNSLAAIALANDDIDKAREHLDRALEAARDMNFLEGEAFALGLWGSIAEAEGKKTDAIRFYRESISIYDEITMPALAAPHRARLKALGATPHP